MVVLSVDDGCVCVCVCVCANMLQSASSIVVFIWEENSENQRTVVQKQIQTDVRKMFLQSAEGS